MNWIFLALLIAGQAPAGSKPAVDAENYLIGKADSPVRIEVFSDFQCPSCRAFYLNTVTKLITEYAAGNKVAIVMREFPLGIHPVSRPPARYAVAARMLGRERQLKVIEHLYTCQAEWSYDGKIEPVIARILTEDEMEKVKEKVKDPAVERTIDHDVELGNSKKVTSTPTVFVTMGGKEQTLVGGLSYPVFKEYVDRSLK
jgi:protein-disulfide isomerase